MALAAREGKLLVEMMRRADEAVRMAPVMGAQGEARAAAATVTEVGEEVIMEETWALVTAADWGGEWEAGGGRVTAEGVRISAGFG